MPNPEWGVKRVCPSCSARFYDLNNDPTSCPECSESFALDQLSLKRTRPERSDTKAAPAAVPADSDEEDELLDEDEDTDIEVGDEVLEEDDDEDTVPLDDLGERPSDDSET